MKLLFLFLTLAFALADEVNPSPSVIEAYNDAMAGLRHGIRPDYDRALTAIRKAADAGVDGAIFDLAELYACGIGEPRNADDKPFALYLRAAQMGNEEAVDKIEMRLRYGLGVERNLLRACAIWFETSRRRGFEASQSKRAQALRSDPNKDIIQKIDKLFVAALVENEPNAQAELAKLYRDGTHGPSDIYRAAVLFTLANAPEASELIKQLTPEQKTQLETEVRVMRGR